MSDLVCDVCEKRVSAVWYAEATETIWGDFKTFHPGYKVCACDECASELAEALQDDSEGL